MNFDALIITCEHATNYVPVRWRSLFAKARGVLQTHRAWDPGALVLAGQIAAQLGAPLYRSLVTRLLADLNRRVDSPEVFSRYSRGLDATQLRLLLHLYHWPFRIAVQDAVAEAVRGGRRVLHVSCHSFTPVLKGKRRGADIGLRFDPARKPEAALCKAWQRRLARALPGMRVMLNSPYKGTSDSTTTWLRKQFPLAQYAGIELELNQKFASREADKWTRVRTEVCGLVASIARSGSYE